MEEEEEERERNAPHGEWRALVWLERVYIIIVLLSSPSDSVRTYKRVVRDPCCNGGEASIGQENMPKKHCPRDQKS